MSTLYVRNFPDQLHQKVKALARKRRRSVSAEVVVLIDRAVEHEAVLESGAAALDRIEKRLRRYAPPQGLVDSLTLLRESRDER